MTFKKVVAFAAVVAACILGYRAYNDPEFWEKLLYVKEETEPVPFVEKEVVVEEPVVQDPPAEDGLTESNEFILDAEDLSSQVQSEVETKHAQTRQEWWSEVWGKLFPSAD